MLGTIFGALQTVGGFLITPTGAGIGLAALIVGFILKKIDNTVVKGWVVKPFHLLAVIVGKSAEGIGVVITVFFGAKFKWTKGLWNKLIEPFVIDLLDNVVNGIIDGVEEIVDAARDGLIKGLKSDNK